MGAKDACATAVLLLLLPGCLSTWTCEDTTWSITWEQDGVYARLPSNGTAGGFEFRHVTQASEPWKEGRRETPDHYELVLAIQDHAPRHIRFTVERAYSHADVRPPDSQIREWLSQSFRDLGLPEPQADGAPIQGGNSGC